MTETETKTKTPTTLPEMLQMAEAGTLGTEHIIPCMERLGRARDQALANRDADTLRVLELGIQELQRLLGLAPPDSGQSPVTASTHEELLIQLAPEEVRLYADKMGVDLRQVPFSGKQITMADVEKFTKRPKIGKPRTK